MSMKTLFLLLMVGVVSAGAVTVQEIVERQLAIASKVAALSAASGQMFLYSLDPKGVRGGHAVNTAQAFHGFKILGKAQIKEPENKRVLMAAFAKGISESDGGAMACFNPRHGIRVMNGSSVCDFVICFECQSVRAYGFNGDRGFTTAASPLKVFSEFVETYHLERPKQKVTGDQSRRRAKNECTR